MRKKLTLVLASMAIGALASCGGPAPASSSSVAPQPSSSAPASSATSSQVESSASQSTSSEASQSQASSEEAMPAEYSLLDYWAGNPAEEYYQVASDEDGTAIAYADVTGEDAGGWAYVSRSFAYDAAYKDRFSVYKKLSFTGNLHCVVGSDIVMIKIEGSDAVNTYEKRFQFKPETSTYELSLSFIEDWSKVNTLLFFVNRSTNVSGTGIIKLDKMVLSQEEVDPQYDIAPSMPSVPQGYTYYRGEESLSVMYRWGYNAEGYISASESQGKYTFNWGGAGTNKENPYAYVSALLTADYEYDLSDSGFKRVVFTLKGTAGKTAILKFEAKNVGVAKETNIEFTGEEQRVEIDITSVIEADAWEYMCLIFPDGGNTGELAAGEITLSECFLDKNEATVPVVVNDPLYTSVFLDKENRADNCYTVNHKDHVMTIDWNKSISGWESIAFKTKAPTDDWWNVQEYNRVVAKVTANADVKVLFKAYDNNAGEKWIDLKANETQLVDYSVDSQIVDFSKDFLIFVCAGDEGGSLTGQLVVEGLRLTRGSVNVGYDGDVKMTRVVPTQNYDIYPYGDEFTALYNFENVGYRHFEMLASTFEDGAYNKISGTITSDVNTHVIIKPADQGANEIKIALKADAPYELSHKFSVANNTGWMKLIVMISMEEGDALRGAVLFTNITYSIDDPTKVLKDDNISSWSGAYLDNYHHINDCYQASHPSNGVLEVNYKKDAPSWDNLQAKVALPETWWEIKDYHRVTGVIVSSVDVNVLLKPYDNGAAEKSFQLEKDNPTYVDYTFSAEACDITKSFIIFICCGDNAGALEGKVRFFNLALVRTDANVEELASNKLPISKVVGQGFTPRDYILGGFTYDGEKAEWAQIFTKSRNYSRYNMLHIKAKKDRGSDCQILLKVGDKAANEKIFTLGNDTVELDIPLPEPIDPVWDKSVIYIGWEMENVDYWGIMFEEFYLYNPGEN